MIDRENERYKVSRAKARVDLLTRLTDPTIDIKQRYAIAHQEYFAGVLLSAEEIAAAIDVPVEQFALVLGFGVVTCRCPVCKTVFEQLVGTRAACDKIPVDKSDPHYGAVKCSKCTKGKRRPDLRAMPYQDYLKTKHWQRVRREALERADGRCQLCNSPDHLEVHHRTYERRGQEEPGDLTVLCATCHSKFHEG